MLHLSLSGSLTLLGSIIVLSLTCYLLYRTNRNDDNLRHISQTSGLLAAAIACGHVYMRGPAVLPWLLLTVVISVIISIFSQYINREL